MDEKFVMNIVMPDRIPDDLETVVELLRPSMLYSDQVILNCSELNELADAYNKYGEDYRAMYIEDRRDMIDCVKDALAKNPGKTIQIKGVSVSADDFLGIFMDELAESIRTLDENDKVFKKILPHIRSGEIQLQEYNRLPEKNENGEFELDSEEVDIRYINCLLTDALDYEYYTLFDSSLFDTVDRAVKELTVLHNKGKYKHAGFVKEVIPTLPDFDRASLDEIVDIKRELKEPLERFRREVYSFVGKINFLPWEKDFKEECKSIYMTTMKDSVDEIRELTKTTSILKNIALNLADLSATELIGGITASVLAGDYWAIAASLFAGGKVVRETAEYLKRLKEAKENHMYFYYAAGKKLSSL